MAKPAIHGPLTYEPTDQGQQALVPGITAISQRDRLQALIAAPLTPRAAQKPLNIGLFDEDARNQLDMFTHTPAKETTP